MAYCAALPQDGNAVWPNATAGTTVQGTCIAANGWQGIAIRTCSVFAVWGAITTPCTAIVPPCPAVVGFNSSTNWPATTVGTTATGTCVLGRVVGPNGPPQRACLSNGAWANVVVNACVGCMFFFGPGGARALVAVDERGCMTAGGACAHSHRRHGCQPHSQR